ncbi:MAG: glutamate-5-semialdehyde dehydrogenase [Woeseiaceae bacterium]|nr:glutamate-5-semialdehyde dehydrogenase [Woeseiaceae bacterium]
MRDTVMNSPIAAMMEKIGVAARASSTKLARTSGEQRNRALLEAARSIRERAEEIIAANRVDMAAARELGTSTALLDRLFLDNERIESMAVSLTTVSDLPDPLGKVLVDWQRPNGLNIQRVSVPLGVIGIIYESRPNVTADAAALCIKSGNAVILRGGSESHKSNQAIFRCLIDGLEKAAIDPSVVQLIPTTDREAVGYLLSSMRAYVDVVVPRGGKSLIRRVQQEARVPVIGHLEGICHVYLHEDADTDMAVDIALNAKMRRTGICGAAETILVDRAAADRLLVPLGVALTIAGCEIRGHEEVRSILPSAAVASDADWSTEYLDAIVSVRIVDGLSQAVEHIETYGSGHTECIVTDTKEAAERFLSEVDSAIILHNASTQFADGGEFGMGAEIGIATDRIHARGPVGAEQLTSYKYVVRGSGQIRP